jgi:hypothetical protein
MRPAGGRSVRGIAGVFGGPRPAKVGSSVIVDSYLRISAVIVHDILLASVKWRLVQLGTLFWRHPQGRIGEALATLKEDP